MIFEQPAPVPLNRGALVAVCAGSAVVGFLPYAIFLRRFPVSTPAVALIVAAVVSAWRLRRMSSLATEKPSVGEMLLGGWSNVALSATVSLWGMGVYWLTKGALLAVPAVAGWLGVAIRPDPDFWADWVSLGVVLLAGVGVLTVASSELVESLYSTTAGARSPFFALLVEKYRLGFMMVASLVFVLVVTALLRSHPRILALCLGLYLLYSGASLDVLGRAGADTRGRQSCLRGLSRSLESAGYSAVLSPRTGRPDIDPLITTVDLLASSPQRAWVIEVKAEGPGKGPVEWHEASRLRNAAQVMQEVLAAEEPTVEVEPLLILVGRRRGDSLDRYLQREAMRVVELEEDGLAELGDEPEETRVRELLEELGIDYLAAPTAATAGERG